MIENKINFFKFKQKKVLNNNVEEGDDCLLSKSNERFLTIFIISSYNIFFILFYVFHYRVYID